MNFKKITIIAVSVALVAFSAINGMENKKTEERQHKIKLSYEGKDLSYEETDAFLASKLLKDMIDEETDDIIPIDDVINGIDKECFKNNIKDILKIVPSTILYAKNFKTAYIDYTLLPLPSTKCINENLLQKEDFEESKEWQEKIKNDAEKVTQSQIKQVFDEKSKDGDRHIIMIDMIECAHYIDSPVKDDLIKFALKNNLVPQKILESPDYTIKSLETIKGFSEAKTKILNTTLSTEEINTIIEKTRVAEEKNIIIDSIKTKHHYELTSTENPICLFQVKNALEKYQRNIEYHALPNLFEFYKMCLPKKLKLIVKLNKVLTSLKNQMVSEKAEINKRIERDKKKNLGDFLVHLPLTLIEFIGPLTLLPTKSYALSYAILKVLASSIAIFIDTIDSMRMSRGCSIFPYVALSPYHQIKLFLKLINPLEPTDFNRINFSYGYKTLNFSYDCINNWKNFEKKIKVLEHMTKTLTTIIKNDSQEHIKMLKKNIKKIMLIYCTGIFRGCRYHLSNP